MLRHRSARRCVSVLDHWHKGAFVSLEQLQSGALPSHKDPIFSESRYKGHYTPGENNMTSGSSPDAVATNLLASNAKAEPNADISGGQSTGASHIVIRAASHRRTTESRYLPGPLSALPPFHETMTTRVAAGRGFDARRSTVGAARPCFNVMHSRYETTEASCMFPCVCYRDEMKL